MHANFGIVGTGTIAALHAQAIGEIPNARLVACMDTDPARAEAFSRRFACRSYDDIAGLLGDPDVELVTICTPSGAHLEPAIAVIESGRHVIVEKPLEITVERCDVIIEAALRHGVVVVGVFPMRFADGSMHLHETIRSGGFGHLTMVTGSVKWYRSQEYYEQAGWRGTWQLDGGGVLMNQGIHTVDLMQWFGGDVAEVSAFAGLIGHSKLEVEDTISACLTFTNGTIGSIACTTASWPGWPKRIEVSGTGGSAVLEDERIASLDVSGDRNLPAQDRPYEPLRHSGAADPAAIGYEGHRRQFRDAIDAIANGRRPLVDGPEARKAVKIIRGIYRSVRERRSIRL